MHVHRDDLAVQLRMRTKIIGNTSRTRADLQDSQRLLSLGKRKKSLDLHPFGPARRDLPDGMRPPFDLVARIHA